MQNFSQIKLEALSKEKPHNRHSPERSRIQSGYLSIVKYTSWQVILISVYKTYTINKNPTDIAGAVTTMPVFYFGFDNDKFLYLVGSVLQSWATL